MVSEVATAFAGGATLTAWGLHLGAGPLLIGLLVALPQLAQVAQVPSSHLIGRLGVRRTALYAVAGSRLVFLGLAALPWLGLSTPTQLTVLVATAGVSAILGVLGNNAWVEWMASLVPERIRGRYFGRRTALCTASGAAGSLLSAGLIDLAGETLADAALSMLALLAAALGVVAMRLMARQHEPTWLDEDTSPVAATLAPLRDPMARRVTGYLVTWNAAVGIAGSYFALYMVDRLGMSWSLVALHATAAAAVRVALAPAWGRLIDRHGVAPVLVSCSFGIALIPVLWLFTSPDVWWPVAIDVLLAGALWSGHGIAAFQLPLVASPKRGRRFHVGFYAAAAGLAYALATAVGGLLATSWPSVSSFAPAWLSDPIRVLFFLSAVSRFVAAILCTRLALAPARRRRPRPVPAIALE